MRDKKFTAVGITVLAAVLVILVAIGALYYNKVYRPSIEQAAQETTSYKAGGNGPQKSGKQTLAAENGDVSIYTDGDFVIVESGEAKAEFSDWDKNFGKSDTSVFINDFNGDGTDDIIILDDEGEGDTESERLYGLYILTANKGNTNKPFTVYYTDSEKWKSIFTDTVTCSLNQPKAYPQMIQFIMDYNGVSVPLDADTGLAPEGARAWYTETPKDENGENARLKSIRLSDAYISYDDKTNNAEANIYVYASYDGAEEQNIGTITVGIDISDGSLQIKEKSVAYEANKNISVSAPKR